MERRAFLKSVLAAGVVMWAGEGRADGEADGEGAQAAQFFDVDPALPGAPAFPLGVAAGDPLPNGITLWTRIDPAALAGRSRKSYVAFEIARDPQFQRPLLRGLTATDAGRDYTCKVNVLSSLHLKPFETYYYRFIHRRRASTVGRFKTLPAPDMDLARVRFAFISCQDYTNGYYSALAHLAEEDVDFVVHLGDYIYETVKDPSFQNGQVRSLSLPSGRTRAETLDDYRFLYRSYHSDPDLQRLHSRVSFIPIWDDHEFANDAYREYDTDTTDEAANYAPARRQAASQAWTEYLPTRVPFDPGKPPLQAIRIYRSLVFGKLMELVLTDERLYRDGPPCGLQESQRYLTPGCAALQDPSRTMLGAPQAAWFLNTLQSSTRTWKFWGNEVMLMPLKILKQYAQPLLPQAPGDLYVSLDQWDGYPAERARLLRTLRDNGVKNLVALTGDIHSFAAGYLQPDYGNPLDRPAGVEFVVGSVTSANFGELVTFGNGVPVPPNVDTSAVLLASNPHLRYFNSFTHGYNLMDVTPQAITCTLRAVSTIKSRQATVSTLKVFRVHRDQTAIEEVPTGLAAGI